MHSIPFLVNPVAPLRQWDIWQSLYGHCVMPTLKHSIHPETRKQTWNYWCHNLCLNKRACLVTYIQQLTIIKTWCTIYHHHQDFMQNIPASVNPVTPLLRWDIWQSLNGHRVMPTLKHSAHPKIEKTNMELFHVITQQKNILSNITQQLTIISAWCAI